MDSKVDFIQEWESNELSFSELCRKHGVSRQTGYTVVARFQSEGWEGLQERSRAPHHSPAAMDEATRQELIELRREHPSWGPKKLKAFLETSRRQMEMETPVPARSTIGDLLDREGLIYRRRRKVTEAGAGQSLLSEVVESNDVWSADYKGWFRTGDGRRCEPLTVTDNSSRMLLRLVAAMGIDGRQVKAVMESAFKEYGMPKAIRTDNGSPFVSAAPGGLTGLSVWWIRLGIKHERIQPGKPTQNGRHERMHLSMIRECLDYEIGHDCRAQAKILQRYRNEFNQIRPHEALEMKTPASVWTDSPRRYPAKLPGIDYESSYERRRVDEQGRFLWNGRMVMLTKVLAGETIGVFQVDEDVHEIYFGPVRLGMLDAPTRTFVRAEITEKWARKLAAASEQGADSGRGESQQPAGAGPAVRA